MTKAEAFARLDEASEDEDLSDEAKELFSAIYGREPDAGDGDATMLISLCYAGR